MLAQFCWVEKSNWLIPLILVFSLGMHDIQNHMTSTVFFNVFLLQTLLSPTAVLSAVSI